jgi:hypothetical protein
MLGLFRISDPSGVIVMRRPIWFLLCAVMLLLVLAVPVEAGWRDWLSGLFIMLKKFVDR